MSALLDYAESLFKGRTMVGKSSRDAHLRQVAKMTGKEIKTGAEIKDAPKEVLYLLTYFTEISRTRESSGYGPQPLRYSEIDAWAHLYGVDLAPFEINTILDLDAVWRKVWSDSQDK